MILVTPGFWLPGVVDVSVVVVVVSFKVVVEVTVGVVCCRG